MNRMRNQFLARAGLSLDKNRGIRRRNAFDLFEYRLQSRTIAYHLLKSALVRHMITTSESLESPHREPPGAYALLIGSKSPEPLEHCRAALHHQMVWQGTPPHRPLAPASAFLCRRAP